MKLALKIVLALAMIFAGVMHFVQPKGFVRIVPKALPAPLMLVYISGVFEVLGGIGLLVPQTQVFSAWGLIALYVAVFPANVNMAINNISFLGSKSKLIAWGRLPLQLVLIAWAYWYTD